MAMFNEPERLELFSELSDPNSIINPLTSPGTIIGQKHTQITLTNQQIQTAILNQITSELRPSGGGSGGSSGGTIPTPPPSSHERYYLIETLESDIEKIEQGQRSVKDLNGWAQELVNELHSQVALASTVGQILDEAQEQDKSSYIDNCLSAINGICSTIYYTLIQNLYDLIIKLEAIDINPESNPEQWWSTIDKQITALRTDMTQLEEQYTDINNRESVGRTTFSQSNPIIRRYALSDMLFQWSGDPELSSIFEQTTSNEVKDIVSKKKTLSAGGLEWSTKKTEHPSLVEVTKIKKLGI